MKLKLHYLYEQFDWRESSSKKLSDRCYPNDDTESVELWRHLFPQENICYIDRVEFLVKAHGWEIEWMKD